MKKKVGFIYQEGLDQVSYGENHLMKPIWVAMTYDLLKQQGIIEMLDIYKTIPCSDSDLTMYHSPGYVEYMKNYETVKKPLPWYKIGLSEDVPAFEGFFGYSKSVGGASLLGTSLISSHGYQVVLNWMGGLHHAKKDHASGFCYVNDCVLAIEKLLYEYKKVLYLDIDVHHGDGVEEAFLYNNWVLTMSIHQFGPDFFPKTGGLDQIYPLSYKYDPYTLNIPLNAGTSDMTYEAVFNRYFPKALEFFNPDVIVLQAGADTLKGDWLGHFNLSFLQRAKIFKKVIDSQIPVLVLGGGGYTIENVARQWTIESSLAASLHIDDIKEFQIQGQFQDKYSNKDFFYDPTMYAYQKADLNSSKYLSLLYEKVDNQIKKSFNHSSHDCFYAHSMVEEDENGNYLFQSKINIE